jgi:hypothetical protein
LEGVPERKKHGGKKHKGKKHGGKEAWGKEAWGFMNHERNKQYMY